MHRFLECNVLSCREDRCDQLCVDTERVGELDAPKSGWLDGFPAGPPDKDGLARIVDAGGGRDDAENSYYEEAADPGFVSIKTARRGSAASTSGA